MKQELFRNSQTQKQILNPQYIVLFSSNSQLQSEYKQILGPLDLLAMSKQNGFYSYGLDRDLIPIIPALWYCLHLPRNNIDLHDLPIAAIKASQKLELSQPILLIPTPWPNDIHSFIDHDNPSIVIYPDIIKDAAQIFCRDFPSLIDMAPISKLNSKLINEHWTKLEKFFLISHDALAEIPPLISDPQSRINIFPNFFSMRQISKDQTSRLFKSLTKKEILNYSFNVQSVLSAAERFFVEKIDNPTESQFKTYVSNEAKNFTCPVSVCVPGMSPQNPSKIIDKLINGMADKSARAAEEISILSFLAARRAVARSGYAVFSRELDADAFRSLAQLEGISASASTIRTSKIKRLMNTITDYVGKVFDDQDKFAILHGSSLTVFSEFPIGLATVYPDTAPLVCRMPIAYRPLMPLTRALQFEISSPPLHYIGDRLRIKVIECIPSEDHVGKMSRIGWQLAKDTTYESKMIEWFFSEVSSVKEFISTLAENESDILVISAHGHFDRESNRTGFICGKELIFDQELGHLPPVTIFSSCQIWPRGLGTVSVADLMVRQGAIVLIGTLIPIDVRKNALLMTRFFLNIAATIKGEFPMRTIGEIWHFTTSSNAVNDILSGNRKMQEWAHQGSLEQSVIFEFMNKRSVGRLRGSNIYRDSEDVLLEIAKDRGVENTFRAWLNFPGYVPESVFYPVIGWPERVVIQDKDIKKYSDVLKQMQQ
jgi:hypothetical protein